MRLFYFLVDMATTNAYIIHKESQPPGNKRTSQKDFILAVASHLTSSYSSRKRPGQQQVPSCARLVGRHFPDKREQAYCCKMCSERKRTIFCCRDCCQEDPVPLCPIPCFQLYHTQASLPSKRSKKSQQLT